MVAVAKCFFRRQEDGRSSAKLRDTLAVSSLAITSATAIFAVGVRANFAALVLLSACILLCLVCSCISAALIWSLVTGTTHVVCITDVGIEWDDHTFDWDTVRQIRWWKGLGRLRGSLNITVARPGLRSQLTLPIRMSDSEATALRNDLSAFLSAAGYNVRWVN